VSNLKFLLFPFWEVEKILVYIIVKFKFQILREKRKPGKKVGKSVVKYIKIPAGKLNQVLLILKN